MDSPQSESSPLERQEAPVATSKLKLEVAVQDTIAEAEGRVVVYP